MHAVRNSAGPKGFVQNLVELPNRELADDRIYPDLLDMFNDAEEAGEGYRTKKSNGKYGGIRSLRENGYSRADARKEVPEWVAVPGSSEHELETAIDSNPARAPFRRGSIRLAGAESPPVRLYPPVPAGQGSHHRNPERNPAFPVCGKTAAAEIYQNGSCFEEYLEKLDS